MLGITEAPVDPSFSAAPGRLSTGAILSTSRSGSAAVRTRNQGILLGDGSRKIRRRRAIEIVDDCLVECCRGQTI